MEISDFEKIFFGFENISKFSTKISFEIQLFWFCKMDSNWKFRRKFRDIFDPQFFFKITYLHEFLMEFQKSGCKMKLRCCTIRWHRLDNDSGLRDCCTEPPNGPQSAQQVLYHKLLDLRSFETWENQEMSRYTCSVYAQSNLFQKVCSGEAADQIWKIFIKKQKTSAHNSAHNCS